jgi:CheY-like chemotaxis protein
MIVPPQQIIMKILVAEDEANIAESYRLILEYKGHEVTVTSDGDKCLDAYKHSLASAGKSAISYYDLVILDYRMPKKDGVQVAQEILSLVPDQRILLATAYVQDLSISRLQEIPATRAVELIQKPFEFDAFLQAVSSRSPPHGGSIHGFSAVSSRTEKNDNGNNQSMSFEDDNKSSSSSAFSGKSSYSLGYENDTKIGMNVLDDNYGPYEVSSDGGSGGISSAR